VALGDLRGDCQTAPAPPATAARAPRQLRQRDRQPGPLVDDLDAHVLRADEARGQLDVARAMLKRVGDEVRDRLRQAQPVTDDERPRQQAAEQHDTLERTRDRLPAMELLLQQLGHLDGLLAIEDAPPAARRREVVERQARPAQLVVERRQALGRHLAAALHRRQAEPYGGQRPAQLMAGARHQLAAPAQLEGAERGQHEADGGQRPGEDARGHVPVLGASAEKFAPLQAISRSPDPGSGHEQPRAHVLVRLRVELPQALELCPKVVREPVDSVVVDLDEVSGGITYVELDDVSGQLDEAVSEGLVVEGVKPLRGSVDGRDIVHRDGEMVMARRLEILLEEV
jgi:hypothetical protein